MKKNKIGIWTATAIVVGCVIGSGVFVKPGRVLQATESSDLALLAWLLGGLISLAGGLTVAEVASRIPKSGGIYTYIEELYGKAWGFVCGWVQVVIYGPALMSALSLYFASLFVQFFKLDNTSQIPVAFLVLFFLSSVSAVGTHYGAWLSSVTTVLKLIPIAVIGVCGLVMGQEPIFGQIFSVPAATGQAAGLGAAILATLWAYDGWMQVANIAGEIENPSKNVPRTIVFGLSGVMLAYLVVNAALFHVLPVEQVASLNERAAAVASEALFGTTGATLLSLGILISIFGCLNGNILTMTQVPYAMAKQKNFPAHAFFSTLNSRFQTPANSILLKVIIASVMILFLNPDRITDIAMFSMYIFYAMVFVAIFKVRKVFGVPSTGNYKIPFFPIVPLFAVAGVVFICASMLKSAPLDAAVSLAVAALGFPIYKFWIKNQNT